MMTAVIWLRSISATGISAFSGPGARTSAWKMRSVSSWRRTSVVRSIIAIVRSVVFSRRCSRSIGRPPASESALMTDDAQTPTGSSRVIIEVAVSRSARVAAKCSRIACAGEPGDDQIADVAVDDLAALVHLGGDALHDRRGREPAVVDLGVVEVGGLAFVSRWPKGPRRAMSAWRLLVAGETDSAPPLRTV